MSQRWIASKAPGADRCFFELWCVPAEGTLSKWANHRAPHPSATALRLHRGIPEMDGNPERWDGKCCQFAADYLYEAHILSIWPADIQRHSVFDTFFLSSAKCMSTL